MSQHELQHEQYKNKWCYVVYSMTTYPSYSCLSCACEVLTFSAGCDTNKDTRQWNILELNEKNLKKVSFQFI